MKINVSISPDLVALMAAEVKAGQKAVSTTMAQAGASLKSAWRVQITGALDQTSAAASRLLRPLG